MNETPANRHSTPLSAVPGLTVRPAARTDAETILHLVSGLADYERLPPPDKAARDRLIRDMFSTPPRIQAFLGEYEGVAAGYTFIFETYSSFLALPTLYLEDLFVLPGYRKKKVGYGLFVAMVGEAHRRGCGRMEWSVLDWNIPAIDFYKRFGATHLKEWQVYRLVRNDMEHILGTGGSQTVTPP
jgi:GNAT superfamily N-acetyltransferase